MSKVFSNNDCTVRVYSLSRLDLIETIEFPTKMNHASISPDGRLLLAVGDDGDNDKIRAFFHERIVSPSAGVGGDTDYFPCCEWREIAEPRLRHTTTGNEEDACFCTAFSPSGDLCVVASQSGYLTFFDTSQIREDIEIGEAVIAVLKSSRPSIDSLYWSGAVRSISFSPAPWDLFAWAEDQGRVCVVDLRSLFHSRQTIELEIDSSNLERADIEDHEASVDQRDAVERRFVARHTEALEAQDHLAAVAHTADYLQLAAERRRLEQESATLRENLNALSASERQMIDSIGLRRLHSGYPAPSELPSTIPTSINYNPERHTDSRWTGLPSPTLSSHPQSRSTASIHDFMRQRNLERSRASDRSFQPRRRSSVVISNSNANSHNNSSSSGLVPIGGGTPVLSSSPSRLPSNASEAASYAPDGSDPWHTISDAMGSANVPPDTVALFRNLQSRNMERRLQAAGTPQATIDRRMQAIQGNRERSRNEHAEAMDSITNRARESIARPRYNRVSRIDVVDDEISREREMLRRIDEPRRRPRSDEGIHTTGIGWSTDGRNL